MDIPGLSDELNSEFQAMNEEFTSCSEEQEDATESDNHAIFILLHA